MRKSLRSKANLLATLFGIIGLMLGGIHVGHAQTGQPQYSTGTTGTNSNIPLNNVSNNTNQGLYKPADFGSSLPAGNITRVYLYAAGSTMNMGAYSNFSIKIGHTTLTETAAQDPNNQNPPQSYITGLTTVYTSSLKAFHAILPGVWFYVDLATPFAYDGTSNLIVEVKGDKLMGDITIKDFTESNVHRSIYGSSTSGVADALVPHIGFDISSTSNPPSIVGASNVCIGSSETYTGTPAGGTWSSSNTAVATIDAFGVLTTVSAGTTTITYTDGVQNATQVVTVHALPTVTISISGNVLTSSATSGNQWYHNGIPIPGATGQIYTATQQGDYDVVITDGNGCEGISNTINFAPSNVAVTGADNVCIGSGETYVGTPSGGTWSSSNPAVATIDNAGVLTTVSAGTTTITYTDGGQNATKVVTVHPLPTVTISIAGDVLTSGTPTGNQWYHDGVAIPGATGQTYTVIQAGDYYVIVTDGNGCEGISNTIDYQTASVNDFDVNSSELLLYPNPANEVLKVENKSDFRLKQIIIFNVLGQKVYHADSLDNQSSIDVYNFETGVYNVKIIFEEGEVNRKVIIK